VRYLSEDHLPSMTDVMDQRLLLLFDIDGTLLRYGGAREHAAALVQALRDVYGVGLPEDVVTRVGPYGKTDQRIVREVLALVGIDGRAVDERRHDWTERAWEIYRDADLARLAGGAMPGAEAALRWAAEAGHRSALLTGNIEPIAHHKLAAAGLGEWFERGQGAFGSDAEDRRELVPVARERAGGWPRERTVVIGDAPGDVACALADGALAVALLGHFGREELVGAHVFIERFTQLGGALDALQGR
jgi:phosphoglycolate phosphatase-like HAD superfamily hydrolase